MGAKCNVCGAWVEASSGKHEDGSVAFSPQCNCYKQLRSKLKTANELLLAAEDVCDDLTIENRKLRVVADWANELLKDARVDLSIGGYDAWNYDSATELAVALEDAGYDVVEPD